MTPEAPVPPGQLPVSQDHRARTWLRRLCAARFGGTSAVSSPTLGETGQVLPETRVLPSQPAEIGQYQHLSAAAAVVHQRQGDVLSAPSEDLSGLDREGNAVVPLEACGQLPEALRQRTGAQNLGVSDGMRMLEVGHPKPASERIGVAPVFVVICQPVV